MAGRQPREGFVRRLRVYVDNSVFGGVHDDEFAEASKRFFELVRKGRYRVLLSTITYDEIGRAPARARQVLEKLPDEALERVAITDEVQALAQAYIEGGALGDANRADALQIAAATVSRADLILSWNFRHIVNVNRIQKYGAINLLNGYAPVDIRSPLEVAYDD